LKTAVEIRLAITKDVADMVAIYAPFIIDSAVSFETEVPGKMEFENRIKEVLKTAPWLVCEIEGKIAGYAYASEHRSRCAYQWNREVSVYIHSNFYKKGVGSALYKTLFEIIRAQGNVIKIRANTYSAWLFPR
jgi:phosphinothricin acetyltransferase